MQGSRLFVAGISFEAVAPRTPVKKIIAGGGIIGDAHPDPIMMRVVADVCHTGFRIDADEHHPAITAIGGIERRTDA